MTSIRDRIARLTPGDPAAATWAERQGFRPIRKFVIITIIVLLIGAGVGFIADRAGASLPTMESSASTCVKQAAVHRVESGIKSTAEKLGNLPANRVYTKFTGRF